MKFLTKSLMAQLVSYFLLLSLVTVTLVAYSAFAQARDALTQAIFERLNAIATLKEDELNRWVGDQSQEVLFIARSPQVRTQVRSLLNDAPPDPVYQAAYASLSEYLASLTAGRPDLQEVFILSDSDGTIVLSTDKVDEGERRGGDLYFIEGRWRTFVQNVYYSPVEDKPTMTVATPLFDESGQRIGVLAAHLNLERMDAIILERTSLGESGEMYLVDSSNEFVSGERFGSVEFPGGVHSQGIDAALQGVNGSGLYQDYQNVPVIGVYHWVANRDLALLAEMHQDEAFAPARQLGVNLFLIGLGSAAVLAVGMYLLARRLTLPVLDLVTGARRIARGNLDQAVPVHSRNELGVLAEVFNVMQARLRESRSQLEDYARTLEQRVAERTADLQQANRALSWRALQLETSSQVAQQIISILDLDELLDRVANLIQARFGYYFVSVWLASGEQGYVALRAGAGPAGAVMVKRGYRIPLDATSMIVGVCKSGQYRLANDVSQTADYLPAESLPDVRSELVLPLRMGDAVVGALDIESDRLAAFSTDDQILLQTLADQIAIAIRNAQLYKIEQTRRQWAELLEESERELSSSLDLREVPARILEQLVAVVPYESGAVMLQQGDGLQIIAQCGLVETQRPGTLWVPIREGDVFQHIASTRRPLLVDDMAREPRLQSIHRMPEGAGQPSEEHKSWMGVPLISKDRVIGIISLTRRGACAFSADDARLVSAFTGQAAIALENASLYDEITQFNEQLEGMVYQRTQELKNAYQTLEKLDKTKSDFIDVAAHELRTPLTLIRGYAVLLSETPAAADPDAKMLLDGLMVGESRLHEVVNNLLDVSKISSQALEVCKATTNIQDIIETVRAGFKVDLAERRLTLTADGLDNLPAFQADPDLLSKVFYHLIINAIKYTPDGGWIRVTGRLIAEAAQMSVIEVVVSDTGIGIDPAYHELIFEKFFQIGQTTAHSSGRTKFKGGGPGMGLAIAKGIVLAHSGKIWVESEGCDEQRCPGCHFHICLPLES